MGWFMTWARSAFCALGWMLASVSTLGWAAPPSSGPSSSPSQATTDWAAAAETDIEAIHRLLRDNHPGAVDPENSAFAQWLEQGREVALAQAKAARNQAGYWQAVRRYTNGFREGHVQFGPKVAPTFEWPGLLTRTDADGRTRVVVNASVPFIPLGSELLDCDGQAPDALLKLWVDPYRWNADIPHAREQASLNLLVPMAGMDAKPQQCRFRIQDREQVLRLRWSPLSAKRRLALISQGLGQPTPPLGLRQVGGVWFVSLPTFSFDDQAGIRRMQALLRRVRALAPKLHAAPWVVLDVRGNGGGNSTWADQMASALYGRAQVDSVEKELNSQIDWRASAQNVASLKDRADMSRRAGDSATAAYFLTIAQALERAIQQGQTFWREPDESPQQAMAAGSAAMALAVSPFHGQVFLLTDHACFSSCLDFADIARRLPGVVHVGLPTSADSVYIDITGGTLPSGQGMFYYSMKVYRHRVRANNVWYEPEIRWPGGALTDAAVARWIKGLRP